MANTSVTSGPPQRGLFVSSGNLFVYSGGVVVSATVAQGGTETLFFGGVASSTNLEFGGAEVISSGGLASGTVLNGVAAETILMGGTASGTVVYYGSETVSSGGMAVGGTVSTDVGVLVIDGGGTADGTTIVDDGLATVNLGGTASGLILSAGGAARVDGTAAGSVVASGGLQFIQGGVDSGGTVASGGKEYVISGTADGTTVEEGGSISLGSSIAVKSGGSTSGVILAGGTEIVISRTTATDTMVGSGGTLLVLPGGVTNGTIGTVTSTGVAILSAGRSVVVSSTAAPLAGAVISNGFNEYVLPGGVTQGTEIGSGGEADIYAGGSESGTTVDGGGNDTISSGGTATATQVLAGGSQSITASGGIATGTVISDGGYQVVSGGGTATGTVINSGGTEFIGENGTAIGTVLKSGFIASVGAYSHISGWIVSSGAVETAGAGAIYSGFVISNNGESDAEFGGRAIGFQIDSGGSQYLFSGGIASGTVVKDGGVDYVLGNSVASGSTVQDGGIEYVSVGGTLAGGTVNSGGVEVIAGGTASGTVLDVGADIYLASFAFASGGSAGIVPGTTNDLSVTVGGETYTQLLGGDYSGASFDVVAAPGTLTGTVVTLDSNVPCYCRGTRILTDHGEVAVEALRLGDRVVTHAGGARPVRWIGWRRYDGRFIAGNRDMLPIVIRAGALADDVPRRDLRVSPRHAMFLDGVLIPAALLVNGVSVVQAAQVAELTYFHIELDRHDVIVAEGAQSESFIDHDSRLMFQNAGECLVLSPALPVTEDYAPRIEDGEVLQAVRRRIAGRAGLAADHAGDAVMPGALEGRVDEMNSEHVSGWAFDATRPHTPVRLDIMVDGMVVGAVFADRFRPDLAAAGKGDGRCAFTCQLPVAVSAGRLVQIRRCVDGAMLTDPAPGPLDGRVDRNDAVAVAGWALDAAWPGVPVQLEVFWGDRIIGRTVADRYRPDLAQAGLAGGFCGFEFWFAPGSSSCDPRDVQVRRASDRSPLPVPRSRHSAA